MKSRTLMCIPAMTLFVALAIPVGLSGQKQDDKPKHHHYKLIDLGTFGGPLSMVNGEPTEGDIINIAGTIVGGADTSVSTPVPGCYNPVLNPDCNIFHAFAWRGEGLMDLGTLRGGEFSFAEGINNRGQIVGVSENSQSDPVTGNPEFRAVLWQNGRIVELGTLGGPSSFAGSINNQGQVMGVSLNDVPDPFSIVGLGSMTTMTQTRGFLLEHGKMRDLGSIGGPDIFPMFLNEEGDVAGVAYTSNDADPNTGFPHMDPFLWRNGKMQDLGNLGGTNAPAGIGPFLFFVAGLNNRGEVVGFMDLPDDQIAHAFLWDGEKLVDLNALGSGLGGNLSFAAGLNGSGEVVGSATLPGDQVQHAFLWRNGVMTDLGTPSGDTCSQAENINSLGQVVGASQSAQDCFGRFTHAFLWERGLPSVDLNSLIPPNSPLQLTVAGLITDRGEIIGGGDPVGCGNNDACNHVYVLIPCDENHPGVEGCDYNEVEAPTEAPVRSAQIAPASAATSAAKLSTTEMMKRYRFSMANRNRWFGALPLK